MMKIFSKLFLAVAIVATAFFIIDTVSWLVSGNGLIEYLGGDTSPLLAAIASHIDLMPHWLFWLVVLVAVVILSGLIATVLVALYRKELMA